MRYGYYLAAKKTEHLDHELATHCRAIWDALPTPMPQPMEGVSAWVLDNELTIRRTVRNFFTGKYECQDIETGPTAAWLGIGPPVPLGCAS